MVNSFVMVDTKTSLSSAELKEALMSKVHLTNAKQIVLAVHHQTAIVHIGANSTADLSNALIAFSKLSGVTAVVPFKIENL